MIVQSKLNIFHSGHIEFNLGIFKDPPQSICEKSPSSWISVLDPTQQSNRCCVGSCTEIPIEGTQFSNGTRWVYKTTKVTLCVMNEQYEAVIVVKNGHSKKANLTTHNCALHLTCTNVQYLGSHGIPVCQWDSRIEFYSRALGSLSRRISGIVENSWGIFFWNSDNTVRNYLLRLSCWELRLHVRQMFWAEKMASHFSKTTYNKMNKIKEASIISLWFFGISILAYESILQYQ